jgi:hypothetical protein
MSATSHLRQRAPWWLRVSIVLAALTFLGGAGAASGLLNSATPVDTPTTRAVASGPAPEITNFATRSVSNAQQSLVKRYTSDGRTPTDLLPAYRWGNLSISSVSETGIDNAQSSAARDLFGSISSFLFLLTAVIWSLIIAALRFALVFDIFTNGAIARTINAGFLTLSNNVIRSGLIILPLVAGIGVGIKHALDGKASQALKTLLGTTLPIAFLWALTANTPGAAQTVDQSVSEAEQTLTDAGNPANGGPLWLANTAVGFVDQIASGVATGFGAVDGTADPLADPYPAGVTPSCEPYVEALYNTYVLAEQTNAAADGQTSQQVASRVATMTAVSRLWDRTMIPLYRRAQYGNSDAGWRIWCHAAEANDNTERAEQATIGVIAGYPALEPSDVPTATWLKLTSIEDDIQMIVDGEEADSDDQTGVAANSPFFAPGSALLGSDGEPVQVSFDDIPAWYQESDNIGLRDPYTASGRIDGKERDAALLMWAACVYHDGQWKVQEAWAAAAKMDGAHCGAWWYTGVNPGEGAGEPQEVEGFNRAGDPGTDKMLWDGGFPAGSAGDDWYGVLRGDDSWLDSSSEVASTVAASRGDDAMTRLGAALMALIATIGYGYVLLPLALGALLAKLALALLLMAMPFAFVLMAFPGGRGRSRNGNAGGKMLKWTGGACAAAAALSVFLSLALYLTSTIDSMIGGIVGTNDVGFWLTAAAPLASLSLLHFGMKKLGLGGLTSIGSMAALPLAAMAAAGTEGRGKNSMKRRQQNAEKVSKAVSGFPGLRHMSKGGDVARTAGKDTALAGLIGAAEWAGMKKTPAGYDADGNPVDKHGRPMKQRTPKEHDPSKPATGPRAWAARHTAGARGILDRVHARRSGDTGPRVRDTGPSRAAGRGRPAVTAAAAAAQRGDADLQRILTDPVAGRAELDRQAAAQQALYRGGQMLTDSDGMPIVGVFQRDENGVLQQIDASDPSVNLAGMRNLAGVDPSQLKTGDLVYRTNAMARTAGEAIRSAEEAAKSYGVPYEAFVGSMLGLTPILRPIIPTESSPQVLYAGRDLDASVHLAGNPLNYLPIEMKERIASAELSTDGLNVALHHLSAQMGWQTPDGAFLNFPEMNGISGDALTRAVQEHLDGKASALDDLVANVPHQALTAAILAGEARDIEIGAGRGAQVVAHELGRSLGMPAARLADLREDGTVEAAIAQLEQLQNQCVTHDLNIAEKQNAFLSALNTPTPDVAAIDAARQRVEQAVQQRDAVIAEAFSVMEGEIGEYCHLVDSLSGLTTLPSALDDPAKLASVTADLSARGNLGPVVEVDDDAAGVERITKLIEGVKRRAGSCNTVEEAAAAMISSSRAADEKIPVRDRIVSWKTQKEPQPV